MKQFHFKAFTFFKFRIKPLSFDLSAPYIRLSSVCLHWQIDPVLSILLKSLRRRQSRVLESQYYRFYLYALCPCYFEVQRSEESK